MKTLAVLSRKGGTGKTTLALHLAVAAAQSGLKVTVADMDTQRSASDWGRIRGGDSPAVMETKPGALFGAQVAGAKAGTELLIVDGSPHGDDECAAAARCADLSLVVLRPGFFDIRAIANTARVIRNVGARGMFVINQAPSRRNGREPRQIDETLAELRCLSLPVAPIGLRTRAVYQRGLAYGKVAQEIEPAGVAAQEVASLWRIVARELADTTLHPQPLQARRFNVTAVGSPVVAAAPGP